MQTGFGQRLKRVFIGSARDLSDRMLFHKTSLVAVLAWVALGADGISSSCYGPEQAFLALGGHHYLSLLVAVASIFTIVIICSSYTQLIEAFPAGGGGYLVASKLLSPAAGVIAGCALLIDYVLTITVSIASGADALFSLLPLAFHSGKLPFALAGVAALTILNLRGIRESVLFLLPVFLLFLVMHLFVIAFAFGTHLGGFGELAGATARDIRTSHAQIGIGGMLFLLLRAYSMGAGTYTGIEAVSNGLPLLREPQVETGKRTMAYMATSLSVIVGGLLIAYLLYRVQPESGRTLNAVLFTKMVDAWPEEIGWGFVLLTLLSEAMLLFIAAQAGFVGGPRVLANMAVDRWFPSRFANLSDRFVSQNGLLLMGLVSGLVMFISRGSVELLVVLYSINVFITFSLSQLGMVRHWWRERRVVRTWGKKLLINGIGFVSTAFILVSLSIIKFEAGGWVTLLVTGLLVIVAFLIMRHYTVTSKALRRLDELVTVVEEATPEIKTHAPVPEPARCDLKGRTAALLVNGFNGLGMHTLLSVHRMFPGFFKNFVFVQVGVVDAASFKGAAELENLEAHVQRDLDRYIQYMGQHGFYAEGICGMGTDLVAEITKLAPKVLERFPQAIFFGGQLVFPQETFLTRFLHNYAVFAAQRQFYQAGLPLLILPIRV
jgi:amino acid transporter